MKARTYQETTTCRDTNRRTTAALTDKRTKRIRVASPASSAPGSPRINAITSSASLPAQPTQISLSKSSQQQQQQQQQHSLHNISLTHSNSYQSLPLSAHSVSTSSSAGGRSSQGPPQSMRARIQQQLPLQPGRKVAFRQPPQGTRGSGGRGGNDYGGGGDGDGETWILAVVKRCIGGDKTR